MNPSRDEQEERNQEIESRMQIAHIKQAIVQFSACTKTTNRKCVQTTSRVEERTEVKKRTGDI